MHEPKLIENRLQQREDRFSLFHTSVLCVMSDDVVLCVARVTQRNRENMAKFQRGSILISSVLLLCL